MLGPFHGATIRWWPNSIWKVSSALWCVFLQRRPPSLGFGVPAQVPRSVAVAALTVHTALGCRLVVLSARRKISNGFPDLTCHAPLLCHAIYHADFVHEASCLLI